MVDTAAPLVSQRTRSTARTRTRTSARTAVIPPRPLAGLAAATLPDPDLVAGFDPGARPVSVAPAEAVAPAARVAQPDTGTPSDPVASAAATRSQTSTGLLARAARESDPEERKRLQDEVVVMHIGLAKAIAARYRGRGVAEEDLVQAASMALLKAARSFDPDRGSEFLSYAVVTMKGEVKRQFRDFGWMVRPPRPIQKLQADVATAQSALTQQLGRSPKVPEVAEHLGVREDDVLEALTADGCFTPTSLDLPIGESGGGVLGDTLSVEDDDLQDAEARVMLMPAIRKLPELEREILYLRFFKQQSQSQIAAQVGVTQMQVSRILSRVLTKLRGQLS